MKSDLISETMDRAMALMRLAFMQVLKQQPDFHVKYVSLNRTIVNCLEDGDRSRAARLMHQSLTETKARFATVLDNDVTY